MNLVNGNVVCTHKWIQQQYRYDISPKPRESFNGVFCDICGMRGSYDPRENPVSSVYVFSHNVYKTDEKESCGN